MDKGKIAKEGVKLGADVVGESFGIPPQVTNMAVDAGTKLAHEGVNAVQGNDSAAMAPNAPHSDAHRQAALDPQKNFR